ncbi:hypothetical protein CRM22_007683 [Opisthorchis felineus]|uniref:Uncharacterized protein n=1 Tax=Opisthorchis felineus TaxID=147828 RepID=A0A4S2LEV8_OPIFE|nr:hypothetical protein CRM22_007683 [Opisthorchis felineus]
MQSDCLFVSESYHVPASPAVNPATTSVVSVACGFPLSMVSTRHGLSIGSGGVSSPTQLFSPAPVRSGKTPVSPVAPMEFTGILSSEYSDDDADEVEIHESRHSALRTIHPDKRLIEEDRTQVAKTDIFKNSSELLANQNAEVSFSNSDHVLFRSDCSHYHDKYHLYSLEYNKSVDDSFPHDEEFNFRMRAEPVSLSVDIMISSGLHTAIVFDDGAPKDLINQSVFKRRIQKSSSSHCIAIIGDIPRAPSQRASCASCSLDNPH